MGGEMSKKKEDMISIIDCYRYEKDGVVS